VNALEVTEDAIDNFKDANEEFPHNLAADIFELNLADLHANNPNNAPPPTWYLDSGASAHVSGYQSALSNLKEGDTSRVVKTAGGQSLPTAGTGTVTLNLDEGIKETVIYVPSVRKNLLSVGSLTD
jgi:hypothetical protein